VATPNRLPLPMSQYSTRRMPLARSLGT
jgi:hypothetical protein